MDIAKLNEKIRLQGLTTTKLADIIGINRSTFNRKLKGGGVGFVLWEIKSIIKTLELNKQEASEIFLP